MMPQPIRPPCAIMPPSDDQGVGDALRAAFLPYGRDMPGEFSRLLDRLR